MPWEQRYFSPQAWLHYIGQWTRAEWFVWTEQGSRHSRQQWAQDA